MKKFSIGSTEYIRGKTNYFVFCLRFFLLHKIRRYTCHSVGLQKQRKEFIEREEKPLGGRRRPRRCDELASGGCLRVIEKAREVADRFNRPTGMDYGYIRLHPAAEKPGPAASKGPC
ncbi:hypothetical protein TWF173_011563 [Orbilia oligospora]|nr:hypothetical protein TWF173_011563 [Orbilia oligospora]